jgi:preprotein translocase subunit YajC
MGPFAVGILVPLGSFAMVFGIAYMIITAISRARMAKTQERLALIERGADPHLFESVKKGNSNHVIKWGVFLLGIGLGIVVAAILEKNDVMDEDAAYFSMIFIFGGLALVGSHFLLRKQEKEDEVKI